MQIVTGIEVNSEANFAEVAGILPKCRRHAGNIPATSMMTVTICFVIPLIEMETELI